MLGLSYTEYAFMNSWHCLFASSVDNLDFIEPIPGLLFKHVKYKCIEMVMQFDNCGEGRWRPSIHGFNTWLRSYIITIHFHYIKEENGHQVYVIPPAPMCRVFEVPKAHTPWNEY